MVSFICQKLNLIKSYEEEYKIDCAIYSNVGVVRDKTSKDFGVANFSQIPNVFRACMLSCRNRGFQECPYVL